MEERVFIEKTTLINSKKGMWTYSILLLSLLLRPEAIGLYKVFYRTGTIDWTSFLRAIGYPFVFGIILIVLLELLMNHGSVPTVVTVDQQSLTIVKGNKNNFVPFSDIEKCLFKHNHEGDLVTLILKTNTETYVLEDFEEMGDIYDSLKLNQDVVREKARKWDLKKLAIVGTAIALILLVTKY